MKTILSLILMLGLLTVFAHADPKGHTPIVDKPNSSGQTALQLFMHPSLNNISKRKK